MNRIRPIISLFFGTARRRTTPSVHLCLQHDGRFGCDISWDLSKII